MISLIFGQRVEWIQFGRLIDWRITSGSPEWLTNDWLCFTKEKSLRNVRVARFLLCAHLLFQDNGLGPSSIIWSVIPPWWCYFTLRPFVEWGRKDLRWSFSIFVIGWYFPFAKYPLTSTTYSVLFSFICLLDLNVFFVLERLYSFTSREFQNQKKGVCSYEHILKDQICLKQESDCDWFHSSTPPHWALMVFFFWIRSPNFVGFSIWWSFQRQGDWHCHCYRLRKLLLKLDLFLFPFGEVKGIKLLG